MNTRIWMPNRAWWAQDLFNEKGETVGVVVTYPQDPHIWGEESSGGLASAPQAWNNYCQVHGKHYSVSPYLEDANEVCSCCEMPFARCKCRVYYSSQGS